MEWCLCVCVFVWVLCLCSEMYFLFVSVRASLESVQESASKLAPSPWVCQTVSLRPIWRSAAIALAQVCCYSQLEHDKTVIRVKTHASVDPSVHDSLEVSASQKPVVQRGFSLPAWIRPGLVVFVLEPG